MKKLKRNDIAEPLRDKPYLYTIYGITILILSPLIFTYFAVQCLRENGFFSEVADCYLNVIKLILMQVEE